MSRATAATVEFTLEGPCPGRLEEVVRAVRPDDAPVRAAAESHLRTCRRCRSFADNLRLEQRILRDLAPWSRPSATPAPDASFARFQRWLENSITERNQRAIADALHRLAQRILWLDPEVAAADGAARTMRPEETVERRVAEVATRIPAKADRRDGLRAFRGSGALDVNLGSLQERRTSIDRSCRLAHAVNGRSHSATLLVQAYAAWFYGDSSRVPELLEHSIECADRVRDRAWGVNTLAVARMDEGATSSALALARTATELCPTMDAALENAAVWNLLVGDRRLGSQLLYARFRSVPSIPRSHRWSLSRLRRQLASLVGRLGLPQSDGARVFAEVLSRAPSTESAGVDVADLEGTP